MTTAYAALRNVLLVLEGLPGAPTVERRLVDHDIECVLAHPAAPDRVLVGTFDAGLQRSTDAGDSFRRVDLPERRVMSLAANPTDPEELWAGTEPSRVFRSTDGGRSWAERPGLAELPSAGEWYFPPRPDTHHVRWLEQDPTDPDRLYVGIEAGAFVHSEDRGRTWQERPPGSRRDNHSLATHPDAPGRVYSAAGDGYAVSEDYGASWEHPQEGLGHRYCWSVSPDPGDPDTVLLSSARGARSAHSLPAESYVYRRRGDGPWTEAMDGLPGPQGLIRPVLDAVAPGEQYALTNRGLYRTTDAGGSWSAVDLAWPERYEGQTPRGLVVLG
jgi:hypothetical protein